MTSPFNWIQDDFGDWFLELSPLHSVYQIRPGVFRATKPGDTPTGHNKHHRGMKVLNRATSLPQGKLECERDLRINQRSVA